jgi:hypothetical protein
MNRRPSPGGYVYGTADKPDPTNIQATPAPRILVYVSRDWNAYLPIRRELSKYPNGSTVVQVSSTASPIVSIAAGILHFDHLMLEEVTPKILEKTSYAALLVFCQNIERNRVALGLMALAKGCGVKSYAVSS